MSTVKLHRTRRGVMARFSTDQCIGEALACYGEWAEDEIALLSRYLRPGATAVDVGANVGAHTLAFAEFVGLRGRVIAIEAQPSTFALLCHNVIANGLADIVTLIPALAGRSASLVDHTLKPAAENVGATTFVPDVQGSADASKGLRIKLPLYTLDSMSLDACNLIKIDVEGMEGDVIAGAYETLRAHRPVIYFEYANNDDVALSVTFQAVKTLGYRLFWHNSNPFNPNNANANPANMFGGATEINVLCVPDGADLPYLPEIVDPLQPPPRMSVEQGMIGVRARI